MARHSFESIAWRSIGVGAALGLIGTILVSCGSDVTCGSGTTKKGNTCVPTASTGTPQGDGGPDSGGSAGSSSTGPTVSFDGVTSVSPVNNNTLQVTWSAATASLTPAAQIVYNVYLATSAGAENFAQPTMVSPPGATSLVVGDLQAKTQYFVVVRAVDSAGNMDTPVTPVELSATTGTDTKAPTFGGAKSATAVAGSGNSITVSWDPASDDLTDAPGITYEVFWSDSSSKGSLPSTQGPVTSPGATSAVVSQLPKPLTEYSFYVKARDAAGNEDDNMVVITGKTGADKQAPVFAGCTAVTSPGAANATVSWDPATDDVSTPAHITYNVYAVTSPVDDKTQFNLPNGSFTGVTSGLVEGLMPETTYYFVCRAEDEAMNEDTNISYRIATTLADSKPPTFTGITNTNVQATSAVITWAAATDNETDSSQIQYTVYQSTDPDPASDPKNAISPAPELGATSISINNLSSNTTYFWAVVATDSAGNATKASAAVSGTTQVSFENDVQPIFTTNCAKSGCHSSNAPMQGQDLSDGNAYANIVGVPTRYDTQMNPHTNFECQHMNRVEPGNPDKSFVLYKLKNSDELSGARACTSAQLSSPPPWPNANGCCTCAGCINNTWDFGIGMPKDLCVSDPSCPGLQPADIATITLWITQGANDN